MKKVTPSFPPTPIYKLRSCQAPFLKIWQEVQPPSRKRWDAHYGQVGRYVSIANKYFSAGHHEQKNAKTSSQIKFLLVTIKQQTKLLVLRHSLLQKSIQCIGSSDVVAQFHLQYYLPCQITHNNILLCLATRSPRTKSDSFLCSNC